MSEQKQLTPFELEVCQKYFDNGGNKSAAFRACHPSAPGWRESTVWARASVVSPSLTSRRILHNFVNG